MQTNQSLSILLVDDDEALLETVADMLAIKDGLGVQTARDGQEGQSELRRKPHGGVIAQSRDARNLKGPRVTL